jgi:hypothetical protein
VIALFKDLVQRLAGMKYFGDPTILASIYLLFNPGNRTFVQRSAGGAKIQPTLHNGSNKCSALYPLLLGTVISSANRLSRRPFFVLALSRFIQHIFTVTQASKRGVCA